jgi:hypothetical protein
MPSAPTPQDLPTTTAPQVSVLLPGDRPCAARESLARQHSAATLFEIVEITAPGAPATAHARLNDALLRARGRIITVCDAELVLPESFIAGVVAAFDDPASPDAKSLVLQHAVEGAPDDPRAGLCLSVTRRDAVRFGGFDEHVDYGPEGAACELGWRLLNAGLPGQWHEQATRRDAAPPGRNESAALAVQALVDGRVLPLVENPRILALRLAQRRIAGTVERRLAGLQVNGAGAGGGAAAGGIDWRDIPVFVINRNRLSALRRLVDWLCAAGTRRVVIMDNASDYAPLLQYYRQLPEGVRVMLMPENHGPYVLWQQDVHKVLDTPYVVTDSDVVPAEFCPRDLIGTLLAHLQRHPDAKKVGTALRIDNLPDSYGEADTVRKWESQFWEHPVAPGVFAAPIDTTFALYPARGEFSNEACNLRLGHPYIAEHTPWYVDEAALDDEERHYREHTSATFSNWSVAKKDSWVRKSARVADFERRAKVLHIDGGREYIPGWINAGSGSGRFDIPFDPQRCREQPLPLAEGTIDGIHLSHVLEGVRDAHALFDELYRVAQPGAKLHIRVAHGARARAWQDPEQQRAWHEGSFANFGQPTLPEVAGAYRSDWQVQALRLVVPAGLNPTLQQLRESRDLVQEMIVTLAAVKPARRRAAQHPAPQPQLQPISDAHVDPAFAAA